MENNNYQTSEKVNIHLNLATPLMRMAAFILDTIFKNIIVGILFIALIISGVSLTFILDSFSDTAGLVFIGIFSIVILLIYFGYNIFFELILKGKTPGKHLLNIRVVMDDGRFVSFYAVIIRNLFRIIDFLPLYYITGLIFLFATKKHQRVGDFAAGTIVVREERIPKVLLNDSQIIECIETFDNLNDVIGDKTLKAIKNYISGHEHLTKNIKKEIQDKLVSLITKKSGISKPADIDNHKFIISVYNKILKTE